MAESNTQKGSEMRITPAALKAALAGDYDNFIVAATPGGIEAQEKRGQGDLVQNDLIPREMHCTEDDLIRLGFILGEPVDALFRRCTLPPGWKKVPTDHSLWSHILDDRGRTRVAIFYKAAFYDQRASLSLQGYYQTDSAGEEPACYRVVDADQAVVYQARDWEDRQSWLDANKPEWRNPLAYWD